VIVLGASTGGPPALATVLGGLPDDLDAVVVVVQHMADGFVEGLARWLDQVCALPVRIAVDGERACSGTVYLAPSGQNLQVVPGLRLRLTAPEDGQFHVPGVDAAFSSVAEVCGPRAVGVLLTGMGRDGVAGMAQLTAAGAATLAQDEATSVVWGMPGAAVEAGVVDESLPLSEIAAGLLRALPSGGGHR
jgi:two-component system chemotaxis response regulator CheB